MSHAQGPETKGVSQELLATVDLGAEVDRREQLLRDALRLRSLFVAHRSSFG